MIQLGLHTPNPQDSTSIYRAMGPWTIHCRDLDIIRLSADESAWSDISAIDVLYMHRPFSPQHLKMAEQAQRLNKPIWIDFDDDLFNVHISNDNFHLYDNNQTQDIIKKLLRAADLVSASTKALAMSLSEKGGQIPVRVIPNKLPSHLISHLIGVTKTKLPSKRVLWRGTKHHEVNLKHFESSIANVIKARPDWCWTFYGYKPWYLFERSNPGQVEHMADRDPFSFFENINRLNAAIQIIPLIDDKFNRSKSNIALLEGAGYGQSLIIAPNMPEWVGVPGVLNYDSLAQFEELILTAMDFSVEDSLNLRTLSHEWVVNNGTVSKLNPSRLDILTTLLHKP